MPEIKSFINHTELKVAYEYIALLEKGAKAATQLATVMDKMATSTKKNEKSQRDLTALEKERIRIQNKTKKVFAENLAITEKGTKELILGQERLKLARKAAREEAQKQLGVAKKSTSLFQSMTKSILAAGAAFFSINAILKGLGKLLKTVFLGTQDNIDFFNQKFENVKGQFAVLTDAVSNFGQTLVESFKNSDTATTKFITNLGKANPIFASIKLSLKGLKTLFPETAAAMEQNGKDAELLQKMMDELNEKEIEYIKTKEELAKTRELARLASKEEGIGDQERIDRIDEAQAAEIELMNLETTFAKERSRIANERLNLSISTRQDRKEAAQLEAEVTRLETESIKQLKSLAAERLGLTRRVERQNKANEKYNDTLEKQKLAIEEIVKIKADLTGEEKKYISFVDMVADLEAEIDAEILAGIEAQDKADEEAHEAAMKRLEERRNFAKEVYGQLGELGNTLFDLSQAQRERELEGLRSNYAAQIQAAEGNTGLQEKLTKKLAIEEAKIQRKQAQSEQNQALFNILAIQTPQNIVKVFPNPFLMTLAGSIGLLQATIVKSQPLPEIPAFFKGTSDTPAIFTAGEKGSELIYKKDGSIELTPDKTTLYAGKEYEHAIIKPNAETQRILAYNQQRGQNSELLKEMKLTRKAIEQNNVNISFSRNVPKLNMKHFNRKYGIKG